MFLRALAIVTVVLLAVPASAFAHVELSPESVEPGSFTLFTVLSPNENEQPMTSLRLNLPPGVLLDSAADTPGFTTRVLENQAHRKVGILWQGGSLAPEDLALFHFSASVPTQTGVQRLTALQTFADGSTRLWNTPQVSVESGDSDSSTVPLVVAIVALVAALASLLATGLLLLRTRAA
jgi:uncharacterized protein YcnI